MPPSPPKPAPAPAISTPRKSSESTQQPTPAKSTKANEKDETISSADSASTLRPQTAGTQASSLTMTADDHVAKGIDLHEKGSLNESTYHLRIAAKQNNPTGMLLYALACRHGWGMRSNQQEGVRWLRKAVDSVGLEMLENPDAPGASKAKELQKAYRSQFALSIYELGVSYLNGWGIEQDKGLALRCFEIAGQWGDVDAMAEAGFCYAEGVGCKKDMKKAARFYRQAEDNGMSMVGNSW
jgi:TPR repeat protein